MTQVLLLCQVGCRQGGTFLWRGNPFKSLQELWKHMLVTRAEAGGWKEEELQSERSQEQKEKRSSKPCWYSSDSTAVYRTESLPQRPSEKRRMSVRFFSVNTAVWCVLTSAARDNHPNQCSHAVMDLRHIVLIVTASRATCHNAGMSQSPQRAGFDYCKWAQAALD